MITCIINGLAAYPAASQSIKITYANQYVTDDGEYSYDINFPMSIMDNRRVFHNVSRFDVSKTTQKYDDCKLYVSGRLVLSGVGTIISVSDSEIKLQIVGGKSRIKFNEKLTKHYIDEIDLGKAQPPSNEKTGNKDILAVLNVKDCYVIDAKNTQQVGEVGKYVFVPTRDETNNRQCNCFRGTKSRLMSNAAVHPNLMYMLEKVLAYEGYKIIKNDFNTYPWNTLYIASAYRSLEFRHALPHWSSYTFIEEFRKLFNASVYFDETKKTVSITSASELTSNNSVQYEPIDEYSVDYDEEGSLNTTETSDLEYNLGDSENRETYETIPNKVYKNFDVFRSVGFGHAVKGQIDQWDEKKKKTTILQLGFSGERIGVEEIWVYMEDENNNWDWRFSGFWSNLVRDLDSDSTIKLNIAPVALMTCVFEEKNIFYTTRKCISCPSVTNNKEPTGNESTDDDGYTYITVQDALDDDSVMDNEEDDQEAIFIYFLGKKFQGGDGSAPKLLDNCADDKDAWPTVVTDWHLDPDLHAEHNISLSLVCACQYYIGQFHKNKNVDKKNCLEIKFKSDKIPDPSLIYIFHGKKFICEKIELEIKNDEIEPIYTGYFYMMLS